MKSAQIQAIKILEDVIQNIKNNEMYSAKDNIRVAMIYIDAAIY